LAIAAGVVLLSGTLAILFEDVVHGAPFTLKHYLTLVIVTGTMMAGHLADVARRHSHWLSAVGFAMIFLAGTGLVVFSSAGRQAEKTMMSGTEHDDLVKQRIDLEAQMVTERETINAKRAAADKECTSGEGTKCRAARSIVSYYENAAKGVEARLALLAPVKPVAPEAEQISVIAAALGYDKDHVKAVAMLLDPFLRTLLLELGMVVSFGFAFSPKRQPTQLIGKVDELPKATMLSGVTDAELIELRDQFTTEFPNKPGNSGNSGNPRGGNRVYSKTEAEADLLTRLAFGETVARQDELAARWGVNKGTVSKWLKDLERQKLIPARQQIGRCKQLVA
jgi:hypothetical protein